MIGTRVDNGEFDVDNDTEVVVVDDGPFDVYDTGDIVESDGAFNGNDGLFEEVDGVFVEPFLISLPVSSDWTLCR